MAKKGESGLGKNTFGHVDQKAIGLENVQNGGEMGKVRGEIWAGHRWSPKCRRDRQTQREDHEGDDQ